MPPAGQPGPPDTFRLRGWEVFRPGLHNRQLFTAAELDRMVANFARYSTGPDPWIPVRVKLGHDPAQTFARSLGLPSLGRVTALSRNPDGGLTADADGLPREAPYLDARTGRPATFALFDLVQAGHYGRASIEVPPGHPPAPTAPDPAAPDPDLEVRGDMPAPAGGGMVEGPYLDAVALLGDELPAVLGLAPAAAFAAPPATRVVRGGRPRPTAFSAPPPARRSAVDRDTLNQQLIDMGLDPALTADLTDDRLAELIESLRGDPAVPDTFAARQRRKFAADDPPVPDAPADPPAPTELAELARRLTDLEAFVKQILPAKADVEAVAAFSRDYPRLVRDSQAAAVRRAVDAAVKGGHLLPADRDDFLAVGMAKSQVKAFAAGDHRSQFEGWADGLLARPRHAAVGDAAEHGAAAGRLSPAAVQTLSHTAAGRAALAKRNIAPVPV